MHSGKLLFPFYVYHSTLTPLIPSPIFKQDVDSKTYLNSAVVGVTQLLSYFLAGTVINALGNKTILGTQRFLFPFRQDIKSNFCFSHGGNFSRNNGNILILGNELINNNDYVCDLCCPRQYRFNCYSRRRGHSISYNFTVTFFLK